MNFPILTQQDIDEAQQRIKQDIYPVTICKKCGSENFLFRFGCCDLGNVKYFYKTYDKRYLAEKDVCILEY